VRWLDPPSHRARVFSISLPVVPSPIVVRSWFPSPVLPSSFRSYATRSGCIITASGRRRPTSGGSGAMYGFTGSGTPATWAGTRSGSFW
jgi:hypothetical protein